MRKNIAAALVECGCAANGKIIDAILAAISAGSEPVAYIRQSELDALADRRISGRGMMLHKTAADGMVAIYTAPPVVAGEPVAEVSNPSGRCAEVVWLDNGSDEMPAHGTKLFTAPQPQQPDSRDALIAELHEKVSRLEFRLAFTPSDLSQAEMTIVELKARLAAAEKGAARYQYLRSDGDDCFKEALIANNATDNLDREIDAAIAAGKEQP